ncbi:hypothetical protein [Chachezhania antarctica]|uniref:hypothetical protein n=1 Tax=Chachezhania antarctica TaxID=2340860 RepID=UPI0013CE758B|nr:hypothetical protein [Chachezhania antarctica]
MAALPWGSDGDFADWRDRRLQEITTGSVRREVVQISSALTLARLEWGLLSRNPLEGLKWPKDSAPRVRLPTADEIEALRIIAGEDLHGASWPDQTVVMLMPNRAASSFS